ncbi:MAG: bifunctional 2-C-methyl-D-erythritol 4-phosphate cytidylyltransferase/2-C-methyl-D-erythritol 2,4-cyclodiphosphate synthase [Alphaproteobacteria bacterium PA2]|nr:MAG: bifunctional 2-C-methyl-D-erythritol 4-phosphate cytidylyltransferase/2-C-methyl-D-erythritol 2,4-cyclodiphosphate synthase [Alphaproteobacteria bacterium PA2]
MNVSAIVVAAGASTRAGPGVPKPWRNLAGRTVLTWSVEAFVAAGVDDIVVVVAEGWEEAAGDELKHLAGWRCVNGGASRALSVQAGLGAIRQPDDRIVMVHDAARPLLTPAHILALTEAMGHADGALPALPVADTLKRRTDTGLETVSRNGLWRAQTPQAFRLGSLRRAYDEWPATEEPTDDASVVERVGGNIALVQGDPRLLKLTYPEDFDMAEALVHQARSIRVGFGVDAHRWGPGDSVWLCGVEITHSQTLIGHSDADAGLHALTDALLGAIGDGDIGEHFPPSDPQWRGASSDRFLAHAADRVRAKGGRIQNVDVTLVCEQPKIRPHRDAMRQRLAEILGIEIDRVSVKATTTEGMGFTGRGEGLMAQAVATVDLPA